MRQAFDLVVALRSITSIQDRDVYVETLETIDAAEHRGADPRCVVEQLLLAVVIYALENNLRISVIKQVIDAYKGALRYLEAACSSDEIAEA